MTGHEASSNPGIHAKMSPMTMIFGRDESLRLCEKSHGFFHTGEGSRRIPEDFFPSPKNRTKYGYDTGADSAVGRVSYLVDSDGTQLADYSYLGLDQIDEVNNPEPGVTLDLGHKNADGNLDRVDQFNRATDMVFAETGGNIDEIMQGYDVSGNELWQAQPTAASYGVALDELYGYNALNELTGATRGTLNSTDTAIIANQNLTETWNLDGMGNWSNYSQTGGAASIDQDRQTNALNQITTIGSSWETPEYNAAGNMTTMPQPGNETAGLTCTYDAWNRLVEVQDASSNVLATYSYDGLNRRITETAGGHITAYYFDTNEQVLEERVDRSNECERPICVGSA